MAPLRQRSFLYYEQHTDTGGYVDRRVPGKSQAVPGRSPLIPGRSGQSYGSRTAKSKPDMYGECDTESTTTED